jgi:hypothetical protein
MIRIKVRIRIESVRFSARAIMRLFGAALRGLIRVRVRVSIRVRFMA